MEFLFGQNVSPHVRNYPKKDSITDVFLWIDFVNTFFGSLHSSIRSGMFYKIGLLKNFGKLTGKHLSQSFFLEKAAHHQASNFIKKSLQHRCFTVWNFFAKLLKAFCRTPPVNPSNFNSTFLTLRPHKAYSFDSTLNLLSSLCAYAFQFVFFRLLK